VRPAVLAAALLLAPACSDADGDAVRVELDGRPSAIAFDGEHLWVVDDGLGTARRFDLDGEPAGDALTVASQPVAIDVGPDGVVWVAHATGIVSRIDGEDHDEIDVGGALVDVVADVGGAWVGDIESGTVRAVGSDEPIAIPDGVVRLARDGDTLWVTNLEDTVTPVDLRAGEVGEPIAVGLGPIGVTVDGDDVYIANSDDDTVSVVGGETLPAGDAPIAIQLVDGEPWALNQDGRSVQLLGVDADDVVALDTRPRGFVATGGSLWVVGVDPSVLVELEVGESS
jgi:DNA-binding beta-propeller fold protein YncE